MSKKIDELEKCWTTDDYGSIIYHAEYVESLLAHARALEEMLKELTVYKCPECHERIKHSPDCKLAKLLY